MSTKPFDQYFLIALDQGREPDLLGIFDELQYAILCLDGHLTQPPADGGTDFEIVGAYRQDPYQQILLKAALREANGELQVSYPELTGPYDQFVLISHQAWAGDVYEAGEFVDQLGAYSSLSEALREQQRLIRDDSPGLKKDIFLVGQIPGTELRIAYDGRPELGTGQLLHAAYARYDAQDNRYLYRQCSFPEVFTINNKTMIQKNVDYLAEQVKFTGFGDKLGDPIKEQIAKGPEKFELPHETEFNGHKVQATLEFGKSKQSDMYFFNRYQVSLTPESGGAAMNQTFYVQQKGQSLTLKEAYNLMNGRAVYKNELANKQGELYGAWLKLDFKEPDGKQGFKLQPYGEKYGFKLEKALSKQPIMELVSAADREKLINSLEKGNRVAVTFNIDGKTEKRSIEASPTSHGINMFDEQQKLIRQEWKPNQKQAEAASEKQGKRAAQKVA